MRPPVWLAPFCAPARTCTSRDQSRTTQHRRRAGLSRADAASPVLPDTPERVSRSAAAQLFLERARAVEPGFALTSRQRPP